MDADASAYVRARRPKVSILCTRPILRTVITEKPARSGSRNRSPAGSGAHTRTIHRCKFHARRSTAVSTFRHDKYSTAMHFTNYVSIGRFVGHVGRNAPNGRGRIRNMASIETIFRISPTFPVPPIADSLSRSSILVTQPSCEIEVHMPERMSPPCFHGISDTVVNRENPMPSPAQAGFVPARLQPGFSSPEPQIALGELARLVGDSVGGSIPWHSHITRLASERSQPQSFTTVSFSIRHRKIFQTYNAFY